MKVKLISLTQPVSSPEEAVSPETLMAYCARVSNPKNQDNHSTANKLLSYCARNNHWSVFEMADLTVEITTSRAISAQILRHRSFCFQEFSQRYAEAADFETYEARRQDVKNRQNSVDDMSDVDKTWFLDAQRDCQELCDSFYQAALGKGIAKEQARMFLPLSTQTRLYMKGSIRSWLHYIQVRTHESTQKEHRDIALECQKILMEQFPSLSEVLNEHNK
jgi:thymidylate synthase (FAD)